MRAAQGEPPAPRLPAAAAAAGRWLVPTLAIAAGGMLAAAFLDGLAAVLATAWVAAVVVVVRADLDRFVIPDEASAAIALLGLAHAVTAAWPDGTTAVRDAIGGVLASGGVAFGLFWAMSMLYRRRSGIDGLGFGDVKLAGASAMWLTPLQQTAALEIACFGALLCVGLFSRGRVVRRAAVPFGAFLAPAAWLVFVVGAPITGWLGWPA